MTATPVINDQVMDLLRDAAEWRLLGRLFERPTPAWQADVSSMSRELTSRPLRRAAKRARRQATEGLFHSTFGPGGPAPPREVSYHASLELGSLMSAIQADYAAFGYAPNTEEPPDHVAVEIGFVGYLRLKEAYARASGDNEAADITRRVATRFIAEHLASVATPLAALIEQSGVGYLRDASRLLLERVGPSTAPKQLPVVQPDSFGEDDEGAFPCGV
jgi:nitrate reductase assembly molybdenum cofactor insertion protein NarJ